MRIHYPKLRNKPTLFLLDVSIAFKGTKFYILLVIFQVLLLSKCIESGYLVYASPPTILCRLF